MKCGYSISLGTSIITHNLKEIIVPIVVKQLNVLEQQMNNQLLHDIIITNEKL